MSRETDSSSTGPQGHGGAAYPSGTPPYGSRPFPSLHPQERPRPAGAPAAPEAAGAEPDADEPRTETTLTTRIRINIPGSRPIPPVVVRTPVEGGNGPAGAHAAPGAADAAAPVAESTGQSPLPQAAPGAGAGPEKEKTSDWFAPRKPVGPQSGPDQGPGAADQAGAPLGPPPGGGTGGGDAAGGQGAPSEFGVAPAAPGTDAFTDYTGGTPGAPADADPFARGPFPGSDTGSSPFPGSDTGSNPYLPPPTGSPVDGGPGARGPHDTPAAGFPSPFAGAADARTAEAPFGTDDFPPGVPRPVDPEAPFGGGSAGPPGDAFPGYQPPVGPTTGPATGGMHIPPAGSDFRQPPQFTPPEHDVSGDTLVSGIPAVPPGAVRPPQAAPRPAPVPAAPAKASGPSGPSGPSGSGPNRKGRSKLVLLGVAAGAVLVLGYGAGLLMNHGDVPKGTTVLGVDIGNKSKDDAVKTLNDALGNRTTAPLTLTVGGHEQSLKPSVAGLSVDTDATVRKVAHTDYNPVSVMGSLFGGTRKADPVILVDEDKLRVALQSAAGKNSAGSDGMVRFAGGKAIAVPGTPRQTFDVNTAASQVAAAYRTRAETGVNQSISLSVTSAPPKVGQAELTAAVDGFGKNAMSALVTVRAGSHKISFGPNKSLPKFLTMLPTPDGKLAPHIDLAVLKTLYGRTFDGVLLERANGRKTAVSAQDIATALIPALSSANPADKTVTLPNVAK